MVLSENSLCVAMDCLVFATFMGSLTIALLMFLSVVGAAAQAKTYSCTDIHSHRRTVAQTQSCVD
jgi:hypothetical protein